MTPEGISVVEINVNLPNACYYLCWTPAAWSNGAPKYREHMDSVRATGRELGWNILATGVCAEAGDVHALFVTAADNLDRGLSALLDTAYQHRLYLVQSNAAVRRVAGHIRSLQSRGTPAANERAAAVSELPEIHYGLFMGDRAWAERMLDVLSRSAAESGPESSRCVSLADIARDHSNRQDAIAEAYRSGGFSLKDIAEYFDMHFSEVSAVINAATK